MEKMENEKTRKAREKECFPSFLGFMTTMILDIFPRNENIKGMYNGGTSSNP
jgi:hypothetical protein